MTAQILAAVIFVGMFALIIMDKFERQYVTLGSAALVLVVVFGICMHSWDAIKNALNLGAIFRADFWYGASESASSGVNWSTIFFITGMMIMVEGLGKSGFFRWLCLSLAKLAHYHVVPLLLCFMAMSAFLAMFIDSITVVLFLATVTLELAQTMKFDPVPMILAGDETEKRTYSAASGTESPFSSTQVQVNSAMSLPLAVKSLSFVSTRATGFPVVTRLSLHTAFLPL